MLMAVHGSLLTGRQETIIRAALAAPPARLERDPSADLAALAAVYTSALAQTHGFIAGSKRTAFLCAYIFLGLNGYTLAVPEPEVASVIRRVADRELGEPELADWFRRVMIAAP
jgi:death-on-curing protein